MGSRGFFEDKKLTRASSNGFTLIELMIVVVIVAILAVIAVPGYQEQALRGKRAEGKAFALDLASRQERFYTQYARYTNAIIRATSCTNEACGLGMADNYSAEDHYTATIACSPNNASCTSFTISVTPVFTDARCASLTYTSAGVKGSTGSGTVDYCWR